MIVLGKNETEIGKNQDLLYSIIKNNESEQKPIIFSDPIQILSYTLHNYDAIMMHALNVSGKENP